jgi:putative hydrolase of the HAD superfamily
MLRYLLCDLDETVYTRQTGLWPAIGERINRYMVERLRLNPKEATALRERYLGAFGTTLNGLLQDYEIDPAEYLAYVHDLPLEKYLQRDPALNGMLARLPLAKVIFTNADEPHARRVLEHLGVTRHFERIIDIRALAFCSKPDPRAYAIALQLLDAQPGECLYADDARRNLQPAHALGMITVWVSENHTDGSLEGVDYHVPTLLGLERVLAGLMGQMH